MSYAESMCWLESSVRLAAEDVWRQKEGERAILEELKLVLHFPSK